MKRIILVLLFVLLGVQVLYAQSGVKTKRPRAYDYGQVVMDKASENAGIAPVTFDHWSHRSKYTCRLCHVDIAFEMEANGTEVTAADNMQGYYCGACHNGRTRYKGETIFGACDPAEKRTDAARCQRCHLSAKDPEQKTKYYAFIKGLPKERFGNKVNWELAENEGLITPIDYLEGISVKSAAMPVQKDFSIDTQMEGMPNIIFSHKKHTDWNGCETCHPDIFVGVQKGASKYTMIEIFDQKYCGVCHGTVAFPLQGCQRCHTEKVQ